MTAFTPHPLRVGPHQVAVPVVLAPMAGITNRAFRRLCRGFGEQGLAAARAEGLPVQDGPSALYVSEMITSRALVERTRVSMQLIEHDPEENPRSIQLYSVDPVNTAKAVRMLVTEDRADHIDLNFGCPVPKVTRKGGGSALPWKLELFRAIVTAAVREAQPAGIPVTVKMRLGIDAEHLTFLSAGKAAEEAGVSAVAVHGRTASQHYSGHADWDAIAQLKQHVTSIPVLGNGDIWSADDALRMIAHTGVDGVVVGRGCLGRPWLFADLAAALAGSSHRVQPSLGEVCETIRRHAEYLCDFHRDEAHGCRDIRKHMAWYLKGWRAGGELRGRLAQVTSLAHLDELLAELDPTLPWPGADAEGQRGRAGTPKQVALPENWLDSPDLTAAQKAHIAEAELDVSGG